MKGGKLSNGWEYIKKRKNSYRLTVTGGFDLNRKPMIHIKAVHGTKKDAEVELAKFVTEVQNGLIVDGKSLRFSEFTEIWKRDYGSKELALTTYKPYCRILEKSVTIFTIQNRRQLNMKI